MQSNQNSLIGSAYQIVIAILLSLISIASFLIAAIFFVLGFAVADIEPPEVELKGLEREITEASIRFVSNYHQKYAALPSNAEYVTWAKTTPYWPTMDGIGFSYTPVDNPKDKPYVLKYWGGDALVIIEIAGPNSSYLSPRFDDKDLKGQLFPIFGSAVFFLFLGAGCTYLLFSIKESEA